MSQLTMTTPPLLAAVDDAAAAIGRVATAQPAYLRTTDKEHLLKQLARLSAQVAELQARVMATAGDVAEETAHRDIGAWLSEHSRVDSRAAHGLLRFANELSDHDLVGSAMARGEVSEAQAQAILQVLRQLPSTLGAESTERAEAWLVAQCATFRPAELRRLGRHLLEVIAPEIAEEAEARRLLAEEADAAVRTSLHLRPMGDGTTRISGLVPDGIGIRLRTMLEAWAQPRKTALEADGRRAPYGRLMGEALGHLLESIDPNRLPLHGGDATTVLVTIPLAQLRTELASATMTGSDLTDLRLPDPTPGLQRPDHPRHPRQPLRGPRPRTDTAPLHTRPTQSTPHPRQQLPSRRMHRLRHLVRRPPPRPLVPQRHDRPRQRPPALRTPPSTSPRPHLRHNPTTRRIPPIPQTHLGRYGRAMTATPDRFLVRPRHHNGTGVLVLHGSSGRLESARAELLAGHGALALALRWFGGAGQPDSPREIPLELFMQAAEILAEECDRVAILGTSFGAEAALLTAAEDPTIDAVVALAPTPYAWAGYSPESGWSSHWTLRGAPVPFISFDPSWTPQATPPAYRSLYQQSADRDVVTAQKASIAVERIEAEVVLVAGGDDQVWPATAWAAEIQSRRRAAGLPTVVITDEQAGHRVVLPGEVAATGGMTMARGGTPTADARLGLKAWPAIAAALRLT